MARQDDRIINLSLPLKDTCMYHYTLDHVIPNGIQGALLRLYLAPNGPLELPMSSTNEIVQLGHDMYDLLFRGNIPSDQIANSTSIKVNSGHRAVSGTRNKLRSSGSAVLLDCSFDHSVLRLFSNSPGRGSFSFVFWEFACLTTPSYGMHGKGRSHGVCDQVVSAHCNSSR